MGNRAVRPSGIVKWGQGLRQTALALLRSLAQGSILDSLFLDRGRDVQKIMHDRVLMVGQKGLGGRESPAAL